MKENDSLYDIRGAVFKIHNELGPGLLGSVSETALCCELELMGYTIRRQVGIPMSYEETNFNISTLKNSIIRIVNNL
jgi:GxxExxY protein